MKTQGFILIALVMALCLFPSCKKEHSNPVRQYEKSYAAWLAFKQNSGNSYRYTVVGVSWTGYNRKTIITVRNGKVIERSYQLSIHEEWNPQIPEEERNWTEKEQEIGMHKSSGAAEAITFDELYVRARKLIKKDAKATFETKNNGLISQYGIAIPNCVDDCFQGTFVESVIALQDE